MPNYVTKRDVLGWKDPKKPLLNKVQIMVDRLHRVGVRKPDEWTFAWAAAIAVLCRFETFPKYKHVFSILSDMKDSHNCSKTIWPFGVIYKYPKHPSELPANVQAHAYDEDDPATGIELERLKQVALHHVPLRK